MKPIEAVQFPLKSCTEMLSNWWLLLCTLLAFSLFQCRAQTEETEENSIPEWSNPRPVIGKCLHQFVMWILMLVLRLISGILSQDLSRKMSGHFPDKLSYIAASYVKYIEGAGARAVPIKYLSINNDEWIRLTVSIHRIYRLNQSDEYYTEIFESINGYEYNAGFDTLSIRIDTIHSIAFKDYCFLVAVPTWSNQAMPERVPCYTKWPLPLMKMVITSPFGALVLVTNFFQLSQLVVIIWQTADPPIELFR